MNRIPPTTGGTGKPLVTINPRKALSKVNYSPAVIKAYGVAVLCSYLLDYVSRMFKTDNQFYTKRNRFLIRELVEANKPILAQAEQIRTLTHPKLVDLADDNRANTDAVTEEIDTEFEIFRNFSQIYLQSSPVELTDLWIILNNLLQGKKVYTQDEVDSLLAQAASSPDSAA
ncbi:hypothetical protein CLV58_109214 [Spirosoma oryzae]|uniref:Uncharacterized protein n=1 Tax=Spirosoma oryzae TaxID=1469603 RepID=A0A2T0SYJ9_9BACT|nr:hypothetical protein [Spirosoma oryzae]PRY38487.1 hypothetical protein CLV58_109214 [Spirosoma oryzae]